MRFSSPRADRRYGFAVDCAGDMQIRLKLMGVLKGKTPPGGTLAVADGATIDDVLRALQIAPERLRVFTVNGQFERDRRRILAPGDELTVVPPVGGG